MNIVVKRAYDEASSMDGYRALVDRLWPRGVKKEELDLDEWCKDIAPSGDLREWFGHDPAKFNDFAKKYRQELEQSDEPAKLLERAKGADTLTLVYSAKDSEHNQAVILCDYLGKL